VDVQREDFNRTSYVTSESQQVEEEVEEEDSPPMEKEPSSARWMTRLSTCSVKGEGSESEGLSRGPSSCSTDGTRLNVCVCVCVEHGGWWRDEGERNDPLPSFLISGGEL